MAATKVRAELSAARAASLQRGLPKLARQKPHAVSVKARRESMKGSLRDFTDESIGGLVRFKGVARHRKDLPYAPARGISRLPRSVAQWLEHRSPKPGVGGSSPSTPANA